MLGSTRTAPSATVPRTHILVSLVEAGTLKTPVLTTPTQVTAARTLIDAQIADYAKRSAVRTNGITLEFVKSFFFKGATPVLNDDEEDDEDGDEDDDDDAGTD